VIWSLSIEDLDRNLVEISWEIKFLEEQVKCDLESYSSKELDEALGKISSFREKESILKIELERRRS